MTRIVIILACFFPAPVQAHIGSLVGHDHWVIVKAITVALAVTAVVALTGSGADVSKEDESEFQEA